MFAKLISAYLCNYPQLLAYMWQSSEYENKAFIKWWIRTRNFQKVSYRGSLVRTRSSSLVLLVCWIAVAVHVLLSGLVIYLTRDYTVLTIVLCVVSIALYPATMTIYTALPIYAYRISVYGPAQRRLLENARQKFKSSDAIVIAIAGSYGKTTMKELLAQLLSTERRVAFTEGNKNVLRSQAKFALSLEGNEEIIIVEFGEGAPGDVEAMTKLTEPDYAVVTGLAPNHLDKYDSIDAVAKDFGYLVKRVGSDRAFINGDSAELLTRFEVESKVYDKSSFDGWKITNITVRVDATEFTMKKSQQSITLVSGLVGRHNVGPVCVAVSIALDMDISVESITRTLKSLKPYEHRLEPKRLAGGWLVDDAYNGNIDGIMAGLEYLSEITTSGKKIYITSGLVDQGSMTETVHKRIGSKIAEVNPDKVYLIENSVAGIIQASALESGYKGAITLISKPLEFYESIESIIARDDVVLIQNDWPDNYA